MAERASNQRKERRGKGREENTEEEIEDNSGGSRGSEEDVNGGQNDPRRL